MRVSVLGFLLLFSFTLHHSFAASQSRTTLRSLGIEETLVVYPTQIKSVGWSGSEHALSQDLRDSSLYQNFNARNSAYVPLSGEVAPEIFIDVNQTEQPPLEATISEHTVDPEVVTVGGEVVTPQLSDDSTSTTSDNAVTSSEAEFSETAAPEIVPDQLNTEDAEMVPEVDSAESESVMDEPESAVENSEASSEELVPLTFKRAVNSVYDFVFASITEVFPFTAVSSTTLLEVDGNVEKSIPDTTSVIFALPTTSANVHVANTTTTPEIQNVLDDTLIAATGSLIELGAMEDTSVIPESAIQDTGLASSTETNATVLEMDQENLSATSSDQEFVSTEELSQSEYVITLQDFGVSELEHGQFLTGAQLRLSLAGQLSEMASGTDQYFEIVYRMTGYEETLGIVTIDNEISNAINGGYYLFALPELVQIADLQNAQVDIIFHGDVEKIDGAYVDAAWMELYTKVITRTDLVERTGLENLTHLARPSINEFMSSRLDFARNEFPVFNLKYIPQRNFAVRAMRSLLGRDVVKVASVGVSRNGSESLAIQPEVVTTSEGLITVNFTEASKEKMKPGTYAVNLVIEEGSEVYTDTFEFQWGLLSINTNQTEYGTNAPVNISIGALTSSGNTLCNADLNLFIINPDGFITNIPTLRSGVCFGNNVIDVPDYSAQFAADSYGEYEMYLERVDEFGNIVTHTTETFFVVPNQEIVIERNGPTRIYPPAPYVVDLSVHALTRSLTGELVERVPSSFKIFNTDAEIRNHADYTELVWNLSMFKGVTETVSYEFDAPDISPYLFTLGPAKLIADENIVTTSIIEEIITTDESFASSTASSTVTSKEVNTVTSVQMTVFEEHRQWQIASDAPPDSPSNVADIPSFNNYLATTTMPIVGGFAAYDPESDAVEYELQIDDDYDFSSPATTTSSANYPSDAGWSAATFASGATTTYTIQPGDALTDGVTYWWRVRARDPGGDNTYNTYTEPRSFTIDTSNTVSEWYQTLGLQFQYDTLADVSTTTGSVELTELDGTPGDYMIRRNSADTTTISAGGIDALWDTEVASSGISISYSAGTYTLAAGKYLVLYSERADIPDTTNNQRVEIQSRLVINGTATTTGAGQTYIKRNGTNQAGILGGVSMLNIPSDGTTLETRFNRSDTSGATLSRTVGWGGVSILRLADDWDYARYAITSATTPPDAFSELAWTATGEEETGFSRTGANITIADAGRYLVSYSIPIDTGGGTDRTEYVSKLQLDNADVEGTYVSTYIRENEGTEDGVLSYVGIVDIGAGEVLDVKVDMTDGTITGHNMEAGSSIEILKLPSGNQTIIAEATTGEMNPATVTEFAWDSTAYIDDDAFSMAAGTDSFMEVDVDGDYLFFASQQTTNGGTRTFASGRFSVNDVIEAHAAGGQYNRNQGADQGGYSFGALLTSLTAADDVSLENLFIEEGQIAQTNNHGAMSGLQLDSIFAGRNAIMSPEIDHDWVPNQNTWGSIEWNVTEPTGSDTLLRVYYTSTTSCDSLVPDGVLSGNSVGFDILDSTLPISGLSTSTYNQICLQVTLDVGSATSSPSLDDWGLSWMLPNQAPDTPVLDEDPAFDNLYATSTPELGGFVATDYENERIEYEFTLDNDYDFSSVLLTKNSSNYPGDTGWASSTFASGATTTYSIQAADALSDGSTYYWRVRARDPLGANEWSDYSEVWSVTIETTLEEVAWHQTLGLQFGQGTLTDVSTTTNGVALTATSSPVAVTTDSFESVADGSTDFSSTNIWKQASISTDTGDWQAESGATGSNGTGPDAASDGNDFIYTEASNNQTCDNQGESTDCTIEADITDGTIEGIHFDYHMFGANLGTLFLDLYDGASWSTAWSASGQLSADELDWLDSGYIDLSANKSTTTALRFYAAGNAAGFSGDFALDNIRISTSTQVGFGTVMSPEIDHDWQASQDSWGIINWDVTEPAGTDTLLHVYYTSTTTCDTIVPDGVIAGNSSGFDSGQDGLIIDTISTSTYNQLCLQVSLDIGSGSVTPTLNDWTLKWSVPNQVPYATNLAETPAFEHQKSTTTTPVLGGFEATDYETDTMEYELTLDTDYEFGSPVLTKTSTNYPGDAGWSAASFSAGATTTYAIQSGDALTEGITYWWRVRARDPLGTNTWGDYSSRRSITISTSVDVPEWFQTTDEQFVTNSTLTNATTSGDSLVIDDITPTVVALDSWERGASRSSISVGTDRVLIVSVISEDNNATVNVDTVTFGGVAVNEISDRQIGTPGSYGNGMWVGYLTDDEIELTSGTTIVPTYTGGNPDVTEYVSGVYENVDQDSPLRGSSANALTTGTTITPTASISVDADDMMFYITETEDTRTHTAATGYTEQLDYDMGGIDFAYATADKAITADGSEYPEAIWNASGNRLLMFAGALQPESAVASIMSSEIDFDWVSGQDDWGEVIWHMTEPTGSDSILRVYYTSATACDTMIPNLDLSGNAAGFQSGGSPLDISALSTSTYNRICLNMTLDESTASSSPSLDDWAVSWVLSPIFEQANYWWYANDNAITPTDTWPEGATGDELLENEPINSDYPTETDDVLRLRMGVGVTAVSATDNSFKLQYAAGDTCGVDLTWYDVAPIGSTTALWRGYDNGGVSDGVTLPSALLSSTTALETYEEGNDTTTIPNTISDGNYGEWDWVLESGADAGTTYCFRMVTPDGNRFKTYTDYPKLVTNQSPSIVSIDTPFDNEVLASTSPWFEFTAVDPEGDSVDYQIQIATSTDFGSTVADHNSVTNFTYFKNLDTPSDKSPLNDSEVIRYSTPVALVSSSTYWWRVRAVDTDNSANYGEWFPSRSFTIDESIAVTTWFQTTEEQFDTDTLIGTDAIAGSDWVAFASGSTTGTTTGSAIDFDDVTIGNAWGQFSFTETGSANDILYHIEYYTGSAWALIPDSALSGNAAGYDASPVDLIDLDTETYNQIRVRANFEAGTPTLLDWTISWGERVSVPTHLLLFDNEKTGTTSPQFTFYTTDPEGDDVEYEFSWSTDNTFVTGSTTVNSSSSVGFAAVVGGATSSPFTSGETVSYTMQSPVSENLTYWWRVRAKDPNAGNSYSFWSDPWSFVASSSATTSTWYQTTQEQFDTNTLVSLQATTTDSVSTVPAAVATYDFTDAINNEARDFEIDVNDPTDPPSDNSIDTITTSGATSGDPNLRSAISGYGSDAEASGGQYTSIEASDDSRWTITDPGGGDNAVFWAEIAVSESPENISQLDLLLEGYQGGVPAGTDKGWFGIWRPGTTTPFWELLEASQQTSDYDYTGTITTNIEEYFDGSNNIHLMFFNEDDSDSLFVDFVEVTVTSDTATEGTITGTPLDFDDGDGPAWGQMYWSDNTPGASSITYQLEYLNGVGVWELIPNGDLSGNAAGFTSSPVTLKFLNTTTYNEIRLVGNLTCDGVTCPDLYDWTIEWSRGFTVSGMAFDYDGVSTTTSGTVGVAINGVEQFSKTANIAGDGTWTIDNVTYFTGDVITAFVSGADADEAVGVTVYDGTPDISGMRLQKRHISLGSNDDATISNANIALYDNSVAGEDIFFDVDVTGDLDMCAATACEDAGIVVLADNVYSPGADVATHDFSNEGTVVATTTLRVNGSWTNVGTTTMSNSIVIFTATSTSETVNSTGANSANFNDVTFGETSGSAIWTASSTLDIDGDLLLDYGTLSREGQLVTIGDELTIGASGYWAGMSTTTFDGADVSTWIDQNATKQNIGRVFVNGTSHVLLLGSDVLAQSITIAAVNTLDLSASSRTLEVVDGWVNAGTFQARNSEVDFIATTTSSFIASGGDSFYDLTFSGAGGIWSFTENILDVGGDMSIATGTVTLPTATTTISGSFSSAGGTFAHNNGVMLFDGSGVETITASGTAFTNLFYNLNFNGAGSWTLMDAYATTSNDINIPQGTVTFPSGNLVVGGTLRDTGGAFVHNGATITLTSTAAEILMAGGSSFNNLTTSGSGSWSFGDTNVTIAGDLLIATGVFTAPSGMLTIGGSYTNTATFVHNNGTVLFDSTDTGEVIDAGGSLFYDIDFDSTTGGWTISNNATSSNDFNLTNASDFTVSSSQVLSIGGSFINSVGGASTTWDGSTLVLNSATDYEINTKSSGSDGYGTLSVGVNTDISMWNSSSTVYTIDASGSLYSQNHNGVDGALYIFGDYQRATGTEYWSYATDFDGSVFNATTSRQADVYFASGATATFSTSTLSIVGSSTASTTIQNQGAGTYTISVSNGTTTAQYYDFDDLGSTGFSLLASTIVTSLADGAFTPASGGGTAITLSSTTIDANQGLQIYRVNFSTTTAIAVANVTQTDGTPTSYWWFRDSAGNIDGEAYDTDPDAGGDPGSVRWDDSSLTVVISGTVYADDGTTPLIAGTCSAGTPIRLVVEGGATYDQGCTGGSGAFTFPAVAIVGDPTITLFLKGASGGEKAAVVTKTITADVTDMDMYADRVIVRHEDVSAMTISDMAAYDNTDDGDIQFTATTSSAHTLTTFAGTELHVWATTTFTPAGTVTLVSGGTGSTTDGSLHISNGATFIGAGTTTYSVGGIFTLGDGATFTAASSTVLMTATTSGKAITTESDETLLLHELQFTGVDGAWNINGNISATGDIEVAAGTVTGTGDVTLTDGSFFGNGLVSFGGGTTTIARTNTLGGSQSWTLYDLTLGTGAYVGTTTPGSSATTTVKNILTISTAHFLDAGSSIWNLSGSGTVFIEDGTFLEDTSTILYSGVGATDILSTDYYNLSLDALGGSPTYTAIGSGVQVFGNLSVGNTAVTTVNFGTNDPALNVDGDMTIGTNGVFVASDTGSFTLAGSYDNNGTFTGSGGTLTLDGTGTETFAAGTSPLSSVDITGTGMYTVTEHATATAAFSLANVTAFTVSSDQMLAVGGTFTNGVGGAATTWNGSTLSLYGGGNYEINTKTIDDTYDTLLVAANTQIRMWNSSATTTTVASTGSLYSQDHADVDGDLYIFGDYEKTTGIDYWNYETDFDAVSLSGGSERKVDVFVEGGASVTYSGASDISVLGSSTASTTLQNQGSGVYSMTIGSGASTTLNYYEILDADADGLTFSGSPDVADISYGYFLVANNADSGITVGGTVINNNPALTFNGNIFATSTGVTTAVNVTATGTSISAWRFTNHSGSIAGEAFDVDPDGNPGYIGWDNSSSSITISGKVYADEGTTVSNACNVGLQSITLKVTGFSATTTSCDGNGAGGGTGSYTFSGVNYSAGNSFIVYIDGQSEKAATVSEDPVSSIANMDLYEDRVIVRHEGSDPLSIDDMNSWDADDDGDISFTATDGTPDTLSLDADTKLLVWTNKEFEPLGNVTISGGGAGASYDGTLELYDSATFTGNGSELYSVGGSMVLGTGATFDAANSTTTFTTTGASRTIDVNDDSFYNIAFTGTGSWTVTDAILDANNVYFSAGTLTLPSGTTTVSGAFNNNGGTFTHSGSLMVFDGSGSSNTVAFGGSDVALLNFTGSGSWNMTDTNATSTGALTIVDGTVSLPSGILTIGGSFRNVGGAVTHNTSHLKISTSTAVTLLASSSDLYAVTFTGGGTYTIEDVNSTLLDTLTISSGTLALATGTLSIGGSLDASGGTFAHSSGTILFNSSDTGETINPGASNFYNVVFGSGSGGWTVTANATTTNNFTLTTATDFTQQTGTTLYVGGVFTNSVGGAATTWTGSTLRIDSGTEYSINTKSAGGDEYETLTIGANTDISAWNSRATTTTVDSSSSFYSQDHDGTDGSLYVYGDYHIATSTEYWSYATDFDSTDLSGGSERAVTVSMAANSTTTVDGATLNIVGESGNETTVTNQGSGNYAALVTDGTYNAQYFAYRNLNLNGLSLSGTPTISSLTAGDFELAVSGGRLMSIASTTVNANASLVITGARFATTTAITGTNVYLTGTTSNAWTFIAHTGNLDGEDYDVDGATACGSIRWTDSSCLVTQQTHYRWRNDDGGLGIPASEWYDTDWDKRKAVRLDNADATTYSDAVVKLIVSYDSDMQADFDDLRFTDSSGTTSLSFFVASTTNGTAAEVWVKVPTLASEDTTDVFMYYNNAVATSTSSSTLTFIASDDFDDGDIAEYSGDTSLFSADAARAYGGGYGLSNTGNTMEKATDGIFRFDQTVSQGEVIRYMQYINTSGGADEVCTLFGVASPGTTNVNYAVCLEQVPADDRISISENVSNVDTSGTILSSSTVSYTTGWYEVEIDWQTDDSIDVTLSKDNSVVATVSTSDNSITTGGIGFTYWFNGGGWDNYSSRLKLTTEPAVRFGAEVTDGGATWVATIDTLGSYTISDVARMRVSVENSGLPITNQTFDLEYASKGVSPSCEAVSGGSYVTVPNQASCGTSPFCTQITANFADGDATADLLSGTGDDFIAGEAVESPSYTTGNLDLNQDEFTELEYAFEVTTNASDSEYCFRVTDGGDELDTYLSVAELNLRFDPSFGAVTLNNGDPITLIPGATTTVYATGTVTDLNGYADLVSGTSTIYRSGAGAACTADDNNCYISGGVPQCSFTNCSGNSCTLSCYADIYYHADATDAAPYEGEEWLAYLEAVDQQGGTDLGSAPGVELITLRALDVTNAIAYASIIASSTTGAVNATTTIENQGNDAIDVQIVGSDLSNGDASTIDADNQIFATSTFTYSTCTDCTELATTSINYEVDLSKPTTTSPIVSDNIYWGIKIPFGTASDAHSGFNTFIAIDD